MMHLVTHPYRGDKDLAAILDLRLASAASE